MLSTGSREERVINLDVALGYLLPWEFSLSWFASCLLAIVIYLHAMLSAELYQVMNWSMALDGLLFWWLILDRRSPKQGGLGYGKRIAILLAVIPPQIALGAYIVFSKEIIFDVYEVCGRAWPLDPIDDQRMGGLVTWVPATMMSVIGVLIILSFILRDDRNKSSAYVSHPTH